MTTERSAEETAIRAAVEKHCHCDTRWPATARIDDNNMQAFVTDLRAALADNSAAALTEALAEIERLKVNGRVAVDAGEEIIGTLTAERDAAESRLSSMQAALEAIIVRCTEGDKRSDWLPVIESIARAALQDGEKETRQT